MPKENKTVVGIDIGTTKVAAIVGEVNKGNQLNILGVGVAPAHGMSKGVVVNIDEVVTSLAAALEKAERLSGYKIGSAYIGIGGAHVQSLNSRGVIGVNHADHEISGEDVMRAMEVARTNAIPAQREVIHVIPRNFTVDGQDGVHDPVGMSGQRLEVETHIVTGSTSVVQNLIKCLQRVGVVIDEVVLSNLASSEAVLTPAEKEMGVVLVEIGGGTTQIGIFIEGSIWHTTVLPLGGNQLSNDLAMVLHLPFETSEKLKIKHGQAFPLVVDGKENNEPIVVEGFVAGQEEQISPQLVAEILEARLKQIFDMVHNEVKRSGYDGMLPAGIVLTGGTAQLPGIAQAARNILRMPVRLGTPSRGLSGRVDVVQNPSFASAVGLASWSLREESNSRFSSASAVLAPTGTDALYGRMKGWFRNFLP